MAATTPKENVIVTAIVDDLFAKFDDHLFHVLADKPAHESMTLSYDDVEDIRNRLSDVSRFLHGEAA